MADDKSCTSTDKSREYSHADKLYSLSQIIGKCCYIYRVLSSSNNLCTCGSMCKDDTHTENDKISQRKWMKTVSRYYMDQENNPEHAVDIFEDLVGQTSLKFNKTKEDVKSVFAVAKAQTYPLVSVESLTDSIPHHLSEKLLQKADEKNFVDLVIRYYIMIRSEGLFLSIEPPVYDVIVKSSDKPVFIAFGSPFNSNESEEFGEYCSMFFEDAVYGALPPFNLYLPHLNKAARIIANPPYTPKGITMCVDTVIDYMNRVRGGEFIMFLPLMHYFESVDRVRSYGNTQSVLLQPDEHSMYSFFSGDSVRTPTQLYLIVNVGGNSSSKSVQMLGEIQELMAEQARKSRGSSSSTSA